MGNEPFSTACKLAGLVHLLQEHVAANSVVSGAVKRDELLLS